MINGNDNQAVSNVGAARYVLITEILHATVVVIVVVTATVVYLINPTGVPSDLLGFVYGGAISYAGVRAGQARQAMVRSTDTDHA